VSSQALPSNPFLPVPVPLVNGNFQSGNANPPLGWSTLGDGVTLSYDVTTPYFFYIQSLKIAATVQNTGIRQAIPASPNQLFVLTAALMSDSGDFALVQVSFYDASSNLLGEFSVSTQSASWQYLTNTMIAPLNTASAGVQCIMGGASGGTGEFSAVSVGVVNVPSYYLSLITSQYQNSPNMKAWTTALLKPVIDTAVCAATMYQTFNLLGQACGVQLDMLGQLIGVSRTIPTLAEGGAINSFSVSGGSGYVAGDIVTIIQGGASGGQLKLSTFRGLWRLIAGGTGYTTASGLSVTGGTGTGLTVSIIAGTVIGGVLSDADYRTLLLATIARNQWNGQPDSLYALWSALFPGTKIVKQNNMDMTETVFIAGNFSPTVLAMILNHLIVPESQGVQYNYVFNLPAFGCDLSNSYIAGVDIGLVA
jgi:Protein of unknown function (DUF2612)